MATITQKLNDDLAAANERLNAAQAEVASITAQIAAIPAAVANVEETAWEEVKDFFRSIL